MFTGVAPGGALEGTGISPSGEAARKQQGAQFILLGKKKKRIPPLGSNFTLCQRP